MIVAQKQRQVQDFVLINPLSTTETMLVETTYFFRITIHIDNNINIPLQTLSLHE